MLSKYPINETLEKTIDVFNLFFFSFFCFELIFKVVGRGINYYFEERFNWFDSSVVLISAMDITLQFTVASESGGSSGALTALRIFRLVRVF